MSESVFEREIEEEREGEVGVTDFVGVEVSSKVCLIEKKCYYNNLCAIILCFFVVGGGMLANTLSPIPMLVQSIILNSTKLKIFLK